MKIEGVEYTVVVFFIVADQFVLRWFPSTIVSGCAVPCKCKVSGKDTFQTTYGALIDSTHLLAEPAAKFVDSIHDYQLDAGARVDHRDERPYAIPSAPARSSSIPAIQSASAPSLQASIARSEMRL